MFERLRRSVVASFSFPNRKPRRTLSPRVERLEERAVLATFTQSGFTETQLSNFNISNGTAMELAPNGDIWVLQQTGQIKRFRVGGNPNTPDIVGDLSGLGLNSQGERGVLGIAFDPNYTVNKHVYIYYTATSPNIHNRISRFTVNETTATDYFLENTAGVPNQTIIFELDPSNAQFHNGGAIHFDADGKLFVAVGDATVGSNSQSLTTLHGKMLRINADGSIPTDNPFYDGAGPNRDAIWALGLRNPFTFSIQPGTGVMHINDVGQSSYEEINVGAAGANYGWPAQEGANGTVPNSPGSPRTPLYYYPRSGATVAGIAITGGAFYSPTTSRFPASYANSYFFADYGSHSIFYRTPAGTAAVFATGANGTVDLRVGPDGYLYYLSRNSSNLFRVDYTSTTTPIITQDPTDRTQSIGLSTAFTVSASGPSLAYQWQRAEAGTTSFTNIPGATSATYNHTVQASDDGDRFRAVVTNSNGTATSNYATLTATANQPPNATITITGGLRNGKFDAGAPFTFSGTVVDPEEGALPVANWTWEVNFISSIDTGLPVVRPFIEAFSGQSGGTATPAAVGPYLLADVAYRVSLTATDSQGNIRTVVTDVFPNTATLTLATNPTGLSLTRDGQPVTAPSVFVGVAGFIRPYGVNGTRQELGGVTYDFASWSDGGAATHNVTTPQTDTTYTATFVVAPVQVTSQTVFDTGVRMRFTQTLRSDTLNLYDHVDASGASVLGPADVQLVGATTGPIAGSLILDADLRGFTFAATRGVLPPDNYALTLRSAANGFQSAAALLDGDNNGSPGGDYVSNFTVAAPAANEVTVRMPHFTRGPDQSVNVPADATTGLPVFVDSSTTLSALTFEVAFNPALIQITGATAPAGLPGGSSVVFTSLASDRIRVAVTYGSPVPAGSRTAAFLTAAVPASAANRYGERQLVDITVTQALDGGGATLPASDGDGLHTNAYVGDAGRNGRYDSFDVQQASRLAVRLDSGFQAHLLLDPVALADFNGNGRIDSFDVQRLSRLALRLPIAEAPPLPNPLPTVTSSGGFAPEEEEPKSENKRADVDGNGEVDAQDVLWTVRYFSESADAATVPEADLNRDGAIDPVDVLMAILDFEAERKRRRE